MKKTLILLITMMIISTACTNKSLKDPHSVTINILTWSENYFFQTYGTAFLATHPHIDVNVISLGDYINPGEEITTVLDRVMAEKNPDILTLSMNEYVTLRDHDKLVPLSTYIKNENFDLTDISPAVVNYLKDEQGDLYGLSPTFTGKAMYYNKKLFESNGISFPSETMTWNEIFALVERFPKSSDQSYSTYGFYDRYISNPLLMALKIGEYMGLSFYNKSQFTLNTESWIPIFQNVINCIQSNACYNLKDLEENNSNNSNDVEIRNSPFLKGNIAIAIDSSNLYRILTTNSSLYKELQWDVLPLPINPADPGAGNSIELNEIFSINQLSEQKEAAWEFISYISGTKYSKLLPRTNPFELPVRLPSSNHPEQKLGVFYKLDTINQNLRNTFNSLPKTIITRMDDYNKLFLTDVLAQKLSVPEALQKIQLDLEKSLDETVELKD